MAWGFSVVALLGAVCGLALSTQATLGVGLICFGCLPAIFARLWQASDHDRRTMPNLRAARSDQ